MGAAKWQTALCKTRLFAGQTGNDQAKNGPRADLGVGPAGPEV